MPTSVYRRGRRARNVNNTETRGFTETRGEDTAVGPADALRAACPTRSRKHKPPGTRSRLVFVASCRTQRRPQAGPAGPRPHRPAVFSVCPRVPRVFVLFSSRDLRILLVT